VLLPSNPVASARPRAAAVAAILFAGVCAAASIGKLPPALPALRAEFELSLVQASWLVSVFQIAGLALGVFGGLLADRFGPRRTMSAGLALLTIASGAGAVSDSAGGLLLLRALESAGFLLTVLPGPSLVRRLVAPGALSAVLGGWSCYMPTGMSAMMVATPALLGAGGWRLAWLMGAALAAIACAGVLALVPADEPRPAGAQGAAALARATLATPGAWLLALCFGLYAGQFITVFSFLPTVYQAAGISAATAGLLSALGVAVNVVGNLAAGLLLGRGVGRTRLIATASAVMAVCAVAAFAPALPFGWRYAAAVLLSAAGGMIPGTLFATAPRVAPHPGAVATTTGLMQQGSALGQFVLPPVAAAVASGPGGWPAAAGVLAACAVANLVVAGWVGRAAAPTR
jgi:cyanate permease